MIKLSNCGVVHIPKTGGRFVRRCLIRGCSSVVEDIQNVGYEHATPILPSDKGIIVFVRHPVFWLRSLWSHRKRHFWNWDSRFELETKCKDASFDQFIKNVIDNPDIVNRYFQNYLAPYTNKNDIQIGKTENLPEDLISMLDYFKENYNTNIIKQIESYNVSINLPQIEDWMLKKIYKSEKDFYKTYSYSVTI